MKTEKDKFIDLVNNQIRNREEQITKADIEVVGVQTESGVKHITVADKRKGYDTTPFNVNVNTFDTDKYLLREIYLPAGIDQKEALRILRTDYLWDLELESINTAVGQVVIDLKDSVKYDGVLKINFLDSYEDLPEEIKVLPLPQIPSMYTLQPHVTSPIGFLEVAGMWVKLFKAKDDPIIAVPLFMELVYLSSWLQKRIQPHPAQRLLWMKYTTASIDVSAYDTAKRQRVLTFTASGDNIETLTLSYPYSNTQPAWQDVWDRSWNTSRGITEHPLIAYDCADNLIVNELGAAEFVEGFDYLKHLGQDGTAQFKLVGEGSYYRWAVVRDARVEGDFPFIDVRLEEISDMASYYAVGMFPEQLFSGSATFSYLQDLTLTFNNSRTARSQALATLLTPYQRSPTLVNIITSGGIYTTVDGEKRVGKYIRMKVKGIKNLEESEWDIRVSVPYTTSVITVKESVILPDKYDDAEPFRQQWLQTIARYESANRGATLLFTHRLYGELGLPLQTAKDWSTLPSNGSVEQSKFESGRNVMKRVVDKEAKTATYTIEGTDSVLVVTEAEKHALLKNA